MRMFYSLFIKEILTIGNLLFLDIYGYDFNSLYFLRHPICVLTKTKSRIQNLLLPLTFAPCSQSLAYMPRTQQQQIQQSLKQYAHPKCVVKKSPQCSFNRIVMHGDSISLIIDLFQQHTPLNHQKRTEAPEFCAFACQQQVLTPF